MRSFIQSFSLFLAAFVISFMILSPAFRNGCTTWANKDDRKILASVPLMIKDVQYKVVKVQKGPDIFVEIYKHRGTNAGEDLHTVFQVNDARDVYYNLESTATNLFAANIDEDDDIEIVVPVIDKNLVSHLNVIEFEPDTQTFAHYQF